jgi:hypothetical protein
MAKVDLLIANFPDPVVTANVYGKGHLDAIVAVVNTSKSGFMAGRTMPVR